MMPSCTSLKARMNSALLILGEARRVLAERHAADVVEREALEHVLHVQRPAVARRALEQRQQPLDDLEPDRVDDEVPERALAELVAGGLALPQPLVAVGVEDAVAEEILDRGHRDLALGVVGEVGLRYVLDVGRIGSDGGAAEAGDLEGHSVRGASPHDVGRPLEEAVLVLDKVRERADEGVGPEAVSARLLLGVAAQAEQGVEDREESEEQDEGRRGQGEFHGDWLWVQVVCVPGELERSHAAPNTLMLRDDLA
jgi:hypothetical protein